MPTLCLALCCCCWVGRLGRLAQAKQRLPDAHRCDLTTTTFPTPWEPTAKLERRKYTDVYQFRDDMRLVFNNCRLFNPPGNFVRNFGDQVR